MPCHECNLRPIKLRNSFSWAKISKMQPNALLAWQNFIYAKSGCYKPITLKRNLAAEIWMCWERALGNLL
jgi:hypothetical protein